MCGFHICTTIKNTLTGASPSRERGFVYKRLRILPQGSAQRKRSKLYKSMTDLRPAAGWLGVDFAHQAGEGDGLADVVNAA